MIKRVQYGYTTDRCAACLSHILATLRIRHCGNGVNKILGAIIALAHFVFWLGARRVAGASTDPLARVILFRLSNLR